MPAVMSLRRRDSAGSGGIPSHPVSLTNGTAGITSHPSTSSANGITGITQQLSTASGNGVTGTALGIARAPLGETGSGMPTGMGRVPPPLTGLPPLPSLRRRESFNWFDAAGKLSRLRRKLRSQSMDDAYYEGPPDSPTNSPTNKGGKF